MWSPFKIIERRSSHDEGGCYANAQNNIQLCATKLETTAQALFHTLEFQFKKTMWAIILTQLFQRRIFKYGKNCKNIQTTDVNQGI